MTANEYLIFKVTKENSRARSLSPVVKLLLVDVASDQLFFGDRIKQFDAHRDDACLAHVEVVRGADAEINDPAANVGAAIIDTDDDAALIPEVVDAHIGTDWQRLVRGRDVIPPIDFAICGLAADPTAIIVGGLAALDLQRFLGEKLLLQSFWAMITACRTAGQGKHSQSAKQPKQEGLGWRPRLEWCLNPH